jgi:2-polyprenyl-6-methoxyphenol hydroxylase-like FAD-dependent oxidoreductase
MRITIVGAGPVGLLTACLLSREHTVTVLDKRTVSSRSHGLSIDVNTINVIVNYLESFVLSEDIRYLCNILRSWENTPVSTVDIESQLSDIARHLGVTIRKGITVESVDDIEDSIIIGADGARSKIRQLVFNDEKTDTHDVQYMGQLKYHTPGDTRPRLAISAMSYSFVNGLSGSDMVVDFESLAASNDQLRKPGTLHIPIPESVYTVLSSNGRGNYAAPWSLEELSQINNSQIAKLLRIIRRYEFSLKWRGGWLEDARVTVIPLTIYRSADVVRILDSNKLVMLVGDSASGLVFERGAFYLCW